MNPSQSTEVAKPTHEQVALRAELLWKAKGTPNGQDEQIWLEAERQLYDEAKEVFANSATSTPSSITSSNQSPPSVASEKMASKTMSQKSSSRRK